jgi:hypothetical protein
MKFKQNDLTRLTALIWLQSTSVFLRSERYAGMKFIRNDRGAARKGDLHFGVNSDIDPQSSIRGMEKSMAAMD